MAIVSEQIEKLAPLPRQANREPPISCKEEGLDDLSEKSVSYVQRGRYPRGRSFRGRASPRHSGCFICGDNHQWRFCPNKCCPMCGERGHSFNNCPRKKSGAPDNRVMQIRNGLPRSELSVLLPVKLANSPLEMILDSGAGPSVIDIGTIRELGLERQIHRRSGKVYGVGQRPVHLLGNITLEVDVGDEQVVRHTFGLLQDLNQTRILGRDWLRKFGSTEFDWDTQRVRLGPIWKDTRAILEGGDVLSRSRVAIAEIESDASPGVQSPDRPIILINPSLPDFAKRELESIVHEFSDVFASNPKSPTITPNATHVIETGGHLPVKHRQNRASPLTQAQIDVQVTEMLNNGICRPSDSPWSSPIILVTKKDGGTRFVVDYRSLNDLTRKDAYPMPNPRDILDSLDGDRYYSSLDCASAYWAVEIQQQDRPKTASCSFLNTPRSL